MNRLTKLRVLDITCMTSLYDLPLEDFIASIGSCTDLEQFQIRGPSSSHQHAFSLIQPLLTCIYLLELDLSGLGPITLGAADVEEMGKAWVKLKSLRFSVAGSAMPVDLLLTFAASISPSLNTLIVPLDVSNVDSVAAITTAAPSHALKRLFLGSSIKEIHVQPFAELLGTIFQSGLQLYPGSRPGEADGSQESSLRCGQVNTLLGLIWRVQDRACQKLRNEIGASTHA